MDEKKTKKFTLVIEATLFEEMQRIGSIVDWPTKATTLSKLELSSDALSVLTELTSSIGSVMGEDLRQKLERMRFQVEIAPQTPKPESEEVKDVRSIFS